MTHAWKLGAFLPLFLAARVFAADAAPTDAQIAAIVVTANQVDVDAGKLAQATYFRRE